MAALAACDEAPPGRDAAAQQQGADHWLRYQADVAARAAAAVPNTPAPMRSPYSLVVFHGRAVHRDADQLDAIHGQGYPVLRAFIYARGVPRKGSPVANVKPVCRSTSQCEYLPPRKAGFADSFTVSLEGDAPVELRADNDEVVIAARSLAFAKRTVVTVMLTAPGSAPVATRIVYAPPTS